MKYKVVRFTHSEETHVCRNCGHTFKGKICNECGEKVFHQEQLSTKHFFHQVIDFFSHFENKVLKSIWLNIIKPGFITKQNLSGIRVPYANPVQLYLVVSILFYFTVTKLSVTDYTPSMGDHQYYSISGYLPFKWAAPIDTAVIRGIDKMGDNKIDTIKKEIEESYFAPERKTAAGYKVKPTGYADSTYVQQAQVDVLARHEAEMLFYKDFNSHVSTYSKTLIFCMLPFMAAFLFLFFFKQLKVYGASLILATHFMVFNLCFFMFHCLVDWMPARIFGREYGHVMGKAVSLFYTSATEAPVTFVFGGSFEMMHLLFWMPWMFIAFKRLFNKPWWVNLIASYLCSRIFFYLVFGVLKKCLIAFTIWTMH